MVYYGLSKDGDLYSMYRQARRGLSRSGDSFESILNRYEFSIRWPEHSVSWFEFNVGRYNLV
jgi:hypothetical protein